MSLKEGKDISPKIPQTLVKKKSIIIEEVIFYALKYRNKNRLITCPFPKCV